MRKTQQKYPIGTVRTRTRHKRGSEKRNWIKVDEPNTWILLSQHVWSQANGPVPRGMGIHHKDRNTLNDSLDNLELMSKAEHMLEHWEDFRASRLAAFTEARRRIKWTTKSSTKQTGRPKKYNEEDMDKAIAMVKSGSLGITEASRKYGLQSQQIYHRLKC